MDIRKVKKLIELLESSDIAEIEIKEGEESVRISRGSTSAPAPIAYQAPAPVPAPWQHRPTGREGRQVRVERRRGFRIRGPGPWAPAQPLGWGGVGSSARFWAPDGHQGALRLV